MRAGLKIRYYGWQNVIFHDHYNVLLVSNCLTLGFFIFYENYEIFMHFYRILMRKIFHNLGKLVIVAAWSTKTL